MCINHRRFQAGVPKQHLNHADVVASLQQVGGERVAEGVKSVILGDFCMGGLLPLFFRLLLILQLFSEEPDMF